MSGSAITLLWDALIPEQNFLMPAEARMPLAGPDQPVYFVGTAGIWFNTSIITAMNVYWGTYDGLYSMTPASVPIRPMPWSSGDTPYPTLRQPLPATLGIEAPSLGSTAVVSKGSLWAANSYGVSDVHVVVRWFEIDVSTVWSNGQISLVQEGDLNQGMDLDIGVPHLDVDRDGNMMINVVVSGPNQFPSAAYTGRLATDEKGALRYPIHIWTSGNSSYAAVLGGRNRWGDYTGGVFDPVDRKTFWMFGQIPDPNGPFNVNGSATQWTSSIGTARLDRRGDCPAHPATRAELRKINPSAEERYAAAHPPTNEPEDGGESEERDEPEDA